MVESLASDVFLEEVKFILNPVLPLCHFLLSLARFGLGKFSVASPLGFKQSLAHFDRQLAVAGERLPQAFLPGLVLKVLNDLVVEFLIILESTIASSESVK